MNFLIFFCSALVDILFEAWFLTESEKYYMYLHTPKETNEEIKTK